MAEHTAVLSSCLCSGLSERADSLNFASSRGVGGCTKLGPFLPAACPAGSRDLHEDSCQEDMTASTVSDWKELVYQ